MKPWDLLFHDLKSVYDKLHGGQSVETLVNFMSTGFVRRALGLLPRATGPQGLQKTNDEVLACDAIAGGTYWQDIVVDETISQRKKIEKVAAGYSDCLHKWFKYVLAYPIRERYEDEQPKYHLIFGSRHPDAVDLTNRAMVKARRKFVGARYIDGMLFPNQPAKEVAESHEVQRLILETLEHFQRTTWKLLRVHATIAAPCMYTDTEWNREIKTLIQSGTVGSRCSGHRIQDNAEVWTVRA